MKIVFIAVFFFGSITNSPVYLKNGFVYFFVCVIFFSLNSEFIETCVGNCLFVLFFFRRSVPFHEEKHLNKFLIRSHRIIFVDDFITSVRPRCKRVHSDMVNFPRRRHYIIRITPCLDDIS